MLGWTWTWRRGDNVELVVHAAAQESQRVARSGDATPLTTKLPGWSRAQSPLSDWPSTMLIKLTACGRGVRGSSSGCSCCCSSCLPACLPAKLGYLRSILCSAASASATNCFSSGSCLIIRQNNLLQAKTFSLTHTASTVVHSGAVDEWQCDSGNFSCKKKNRKSKQQLQLSHTLC